MGGNDYAKLREILFALFCGICVTFAGWGGLTNQAGGMDEQVRLAMGWTRLRADEELRRGHTGREEDGWAKNTPRLTLA